MSKSLKKGMGKFDGIAGYSGRLAGVPLSASDSERPDKQLRSRVRKEQNSQPTLAFQVIFIFLFIIIDLPTYCLFIYM